MDAGVVKHAAFEATDPHQEIAVSHHHDVS